MASNTKAVEMLSSTASRASSAIGSPSTQPTTPTEYDAADFLTAFKDLSAAARAQYWRPGYHLQAREGWMNDPCGPGFDPATGLYHVSFQWNPFGNDWGNMSWCSATSTDMLNWKIEPKSTLKPDQPYDCEGVFTGCFVNGQDGSIHHVYTSVSSLPIHYTLPHPRGCESLSLASSYDNGKTWTKSPHNPILPGEPSHFNVTGWRDPYVTRWPAMSNALGVQTDQALFGLVSGGLRNDAPAAFVYTVDSADLTRWKYVGIIADKQPEMVPSRWSVNMGINWECANLVSDLWDLKDRSLKRDFLITGVEGCRDDDDSEPASIVSRPDRSQVWTCVSPSVDGAIVVVRKDFAGNLDHGCFYAANSFPDPQSGRQVVYGWIDEDDLSDDLRHAQGWSGLLSLPRDLTLLTMHNVIAACESDLSAVNSIEVEADGHGSNTIRTLASQPCPSVVEKLRNSAGVNRLGFGAAALTSEAPTVRIAEDVQSLQWELQCSLSVAKSCRSVGVRISDQNNPEQSIILVFSPRSELFQIHRPSLPDSNPDKLINSRSESAPHTLFTIRNPDTRIEHTEALEIRAWRDNSVLEVFVNGRTAISTRIYSTHGVCDISAFAEDTRAEESRTALLGGNLWIDIGLT